MFYFFFFKQKTAYEMRISDWSSDVCSSDLILGRLFETLFARGVVVVATSNWPPDRLYEGGLQREHFLPFVALVKQRLDVLDLHSRVDYRLPRLTDIAAYHPPLLPRAETALATPLAQLPEARAPPPHSTPFNGRGIPVPRTPAAAPPLTLTTQTRPT